MYGTFCPRRLCRRRRRHMSSLVQPIVSPETLVLVACFLNVNTFRLGTCVASRRVPVVGRQSICVMVLDASGGRQSN